MPSSGTVPTLCQVKSWDTSHLTEAASHWTQTAAVWENHFTALSTQIGSPGGTPWEGVAAEAAQQRAYDDRMKVIGAADQLHEASSAARTGAQQIQSAKSAALNAINAAEDAGFTVGEDFSITDRATGGNAVARAARQVQAQTHSAAIRERVGALIAADQQVAGRLTTAAGGLGSVSFPDDEIVGEGGRKDPTIKAVDNHTGEKPEPVRQGQNADPANSFVGDGRFGRWEDVPPPPPYTGANPPPLKDQYRPFPPGTPAKNGGPTEWYVPGKSWIGDIDPPLVQRQEQYKFRIAGEDATTTTRMVTNNGVAQEQRWVQNVYEAQHNTWWKVDGTIPVKGEGGWDEGDISIPTPPSFGQWQQMPLNQIATLSATNPDVTFYMPDGCGGQFNYSGGVPVGGISGLPANPVPIMTAPR
ncbi:WXG100 family type VII secretion target [Mycolicibacterium sphagni]|uniref:WXG100 family type VII secretion target n=1 Tax=Mycolicibacterium sphagni TaxID=1786 RepID=UPI0021F31B7F|nr:hypothetical protein [Mycolicibacterium sphagni]MCV7177405.1 hypothetical protein [Mycolicibacterium sphagni]